MPAGKLRASNRVVSGIIPAWYGMNIPNRKSVKTTSDPGNFHRDSTKPLSEPRTVEITVAGIASLKLLARFGDSCVHASRHASTVQTSGSDQAWLGSVSATPFRLVTTST